MIGRFFRALRTLLQLTTLNTGGRGRIAHKIYQLSRRAFFSHDPDAWSTDIRDIILLFLQNPDPFKTQIGTVRRSVQSWAQSTSTRANIKQRKSLILPSSCYRLTGQAPGEITSQCPCRRALEGCQRLPWIFLCIFIRFCVELVELV